MAAGGADALLLESEIGPLPKDGRGGVDAAGLGLRTRFEFLPDTLGVETFAEGHCTGATPGQLIRHGRV